MGRQAILCVDDERIILDSLKAQLKNNFGRTYNYEFAESGEEALEIIEELIDDETEVLIILSDWLMPGMKGDELLVKIHERYPQVSKVMLTGQADEKAISRAKSDANLHGFLEKPWDEKELISVIKSGLDIDE